MKTTAKILFCVILTVAASAGLLAQNNPYQIDDRLYPAFERLRQGISNTTWAMRSADSLYDEAVRLADKKAQAAILCVPCRVAGIRGDEASMTLAANRLREVALKNGCPEQYYFAYDAQINLYASKRDYTQALVVAKDMEVDTKRLFGGYGKAQCYETYGKLYRKMHDNLSAAKYYQRALDQYRLDQPDKDLTDIYMNLAVSYRYGGELDKALSVLNDGIVQLSGNRAKVKRYNLYDAKCYTLYVMGDYKDADKLYYHLQDAQYDSLRNANRNAIYLDIYHYCYEGDYDKAHQCAQTINAPFVRYDWEATIESMRGDYVEAYRLERLSKKCVQDHSRMLNEKSMALFYDQYENSRLAEQNAALDLRNSRLALQNAQMELAKQRSVTEMEQVNAENTRLALHNQELENRKLEESNKHAQLESTLQKQNYEKSRAEHRIHTVVLLLCAALLCALAVFMGIYSVIRRNMAMRLRKKHIELRRALILAEESEQVKMRFLQNMSHEIRTPLNAIVGFSQILAHQQKGEFTDEQKEEYIDLVDQNTESLTMLINDILSISAMENNADINITKSVCLVNDLCRNAMASVQSRCPQGVRMYYTTEVDDNCRINTDYKRVRQVLVNYLTNAEKYTEKGEIHMHTSLSENPGFVTFSVADTGIGVPAENAETIFNRFESDENTTKGVGLGLNICKLIAYHMGGEVRLDTSYAGPGSRFVFILPDCEIEC